MTITVADPRFEPDERWIPVERRWLGVDRRSIMPAAIVMAVAFVMAVLLPAVDTVLQAYDIAIKHHDPVVAGDVMELDGGITFVPEPGWGIEQGVRAKSPLAGGAYPSGAAVVNGDSTFTVKTDQFNGDADALVDRLEDQPPGAWPSGLLGMGDRESITNAAGDTGVIEPLFGTTWQGALVAYVFDGVGVGALMVGPANMTDEELDVLIRMMESIQRAGGASA